MKNNILIVGLALVLSACGTTSHKGNINYSNPYPYNEQVYVQGSLTPEQKSELTMFAMSLMDTKYNWGSKKVNFGLDCSGLVSYVFKNALNIKLTGAARDIVKNGSSVPLSHAFNQQLELGDLLFFNTTGQHYSHVGIYVGNNQFLHASSAAGKVIISNLSSKYYASRLEEIKRV
jgi:cell wall-associated NlpC family hydrolase